MVNQFYYLDTMTTRRTNALFLVAGIAMMMIGRVVSSGDRVPDPQSILADAQRALDYYGESTEWEHGDCGWQV